MRTSCHCKVYDLASAVIEHEEDIQSGKREGRLPPADSPGLEVWVEWLRMACGKQQYLSAMKEAGFRNIAVVTEYPYDGPPMAPMLAGKIVSLQLKAYKHRGVE